jgi:SAM-dependent methyltransferase
MKAHGPHGHGWLVGVLGLGVGVTMLVAFPKLKAVAGVVLLVALFHLVGGAVIVGSLYALAPRLFQRLGARLRRHAPAPDAVDYGWSWGAMNGHFIAAGAVGAAALGLQLELPRLWPAWFALGLIAVSLVIGGRLLRASKRPDWAPLPLVDLLRSDHGLVLDAGCGAGRTTIALSRVLREGRVVALDRFDAEYIQGGGREVLERNLRVVGLTDRVEIQRGDLTDLPFSGATFDAVVSAHVIDHLGPRKADGLREVQRVLKPGGRFLAVVWVPGWTMFAVASLLCFMLTTPAGWRAMAAAAGLTLRDEGTFNGLWYMLLEKPAG